MKLLNVLLKRRVVSIEREDQYVFKIEKSNYGFSVKYTFPHFHISRIFRLTKNNMSSLAAIHTHDMHIQLYQVEILWILLDLKTPSS